MDCRPSSQHVPPAPLQTPNNPKRIHHLSPTSPLSPPTPPSLPSLSPPSTHPSLHSASTSLSPPHCNAAFCSPFSLPNTPTHQSPTTKHTCSPTPHRAGVYTLPIPHLSTPSSLPPLQSLISFASAPNLSRSLKMHVRMVSIIMVVPLLTMLLQINRNSQSPLQPPPPPPRGGLSIIFSIALHPALTRASPSLTPPHSCSIHPSLLPLSLLNCLDHDSSLIIIIHTCPPLRRPFKPPHTPLPHPTMSPSHSLSLHLIMHPHDIPLL